MNQPLLQKIMDELSDAKVVEIKVQTEKSIKKLSWKYF